MGPLAARLLRALARPGAEIVAAAHALEGTARLAPRHRASRAADWTSPVRADDLPAIADEGVWRLDLRSDRPFHPDRLLDSLEQLGAGAHRSRGCFWLPTRADRALEWDGAGGQLSIGHHAPWGRRRPFTRIVVTGVGAAPPQLRPAFDHLLVATGEQGAGGPWSVAEDGFEPWLGPIREVA